MACMHLIKVNYQLHNYPEAIICYEKNEEFFKTHDDPMGKK